MGRKPQYAQRINRTINNIDTIILNYQKFNISTNSELLEALSDNEVFVKYIGMNLLLIGEDCKGLYKYCTVERNNDIVLNSYRPILQEFRLFRNTIAHNYYEINDIDTYKILTQSIPELMTALTDLKFYKQC